MPKVLKRQCLFDNSKECPVRVATADIGMMGATLVEKACPICPIRLKMIPLTKLK